MGDAFNLTFNVRLIILKNKKVFENIFYPT